MKLKQTFALAAAALLCGCATHRSETEAMRKAWSAGNTAAAQKIADKILPEKLNSGDAVIWLLEDGAVARANNDINKSSESLDKAYAKIKEYEAQAKIKLGDETSAFLLNQSYIPYKGYNYDKIMLSIYQAMNFIETKDFERARVELKRLQLAQAEAKRANLERIEDAQKEIESAKAQNKELNYNVSPLLNNKAVGEAMRKHYGDAYKKDPQTALQQAANIYVNPFGLWLYGVFMMETGDNADKAMAADSFRICAQMLGGKSAALNSDAADGVKIREGKMGSLGDITYVIFETGIAPQRRQFRLDLPLWIINKNLPSASVNFPYLEKQGDFKETIAVAANGKTLTFDTVANMDDIISEEFYIELPMAITKTLLSSAAKATAQYFAARSAGDYGVLVNIAGSVYQIMANDADLRTWTTLPKRIKLAKIATPANAQITVENTPVKLNAKGVNIVHIKSMSKNGSKIIKAFDFKPKPAN